MPTRDYILPKERAAIMHMVVDIMLDHRENLFGKKKLNGRDNDTTTMVALAVAIGTTEGKPMTAAKVENFLHMGRGTVLRKLGRLIELGVIERRGNAYLLVEGRAMWTQEQYKRRIERYREIIDRFRKALDWTPDRATLSVQIGRKHD